MNDPRLIAWLESTLRALDAPDSDRLRALEQAHRIRSELMASLSAGASQPAPDLTRELTERLIETERRLGDHIARLRTEVEGRVAELRRVRAAARGYLPVDASRPSLISDDV